MTKQSIELKRSQNAHARILEKQARAIYINDAFAKKTDDKTLTGHKYHGAVIRKQMEENRILSKAERKVIYDKCKKR